MSSADSEKVVALYSDSADSYSTMMESEIRSPIYVDTLGRLHDRLIGMSGPLIDTSCGSGHMLRMYTELHGDRRELLGIDLTPRMVSIATERLGSAAAVSIGDMRSLEAVADQSAAAILSYFALHHLNVSDLGTSIQEWHRVLKPNGQLVIATWEGNGAIDYGEDSDVIAFKHDCAVLNSIVESAGYSIDRCRVEDVVDMGMKAVYLEATRNQLSRASVPDDETIPNIT